MHTSSKGLSSQTSTQRTEDAVAFRESFDGALKSFASLVDAQLIDLDALATTCSRLVAAGYLCYERPRLPWLVRHSSTWSFDDNKLLFSELPPCGCSTRHRSLAGDVGNPVCRHMQRRAFRTRASTGLGGSGNSKKSSGTYDSQVDVEGLTLTSAAAAATSPEVSKPNIFKSRAERAREAKHASDLKSLLMSTQDLGEQQKIKLAFAEGYVSANPTPQKKSSKLRMFNVFRDVLGVVLILVVLFSFMGEFSGWQLHSVPSITAVLQADLFVAC